MESRRKKIRWRFAALIALVMGFPMAEKSAIADDFFDYFDGGGGWGIVSASLELAFAIVDVAGDS